jgi:hypothetical protein
MTLLSLLIPTHERARYAVKTVTALLEGTSNTEIVVCDTSAEDVWAAVRERWALTGRLKVVRPNGSLSVVDNFNTALTQASGDYLCFIGDDDLVAPDIDEIAAWAGSRGIETVNFDFPVHYYWPDFTHRWEPERYSGTLWVEPFTAEIRPHDNAAAVRLAMSRPGLGVFDMSRAYCGLISRDLVARVLAKHGMLFGGVSPDIYSALLLSVESRQSVRINYPGVVPGASGASTAGQSASGGHVGKLRDNDHIGAFKNLIWHPLIPEFYSVPTVWSYSLLCGVEAVETPAVSVNRVNLGRLYVRCLIYYPQFREETVAAMKSYVKAASPAKLLVGLVEGLFSEGAWVLQRISVRLRPPSRQARYGQINDVGEALSMLQKVTTATTPSPRPWSVL